MRLATHHEAALSAAISGHLEKGGAFPLDVRSGAFSFRISESRIERELLLAVLTVGGKDYRVYDLETK